MGRLFLFGIYILQLLILCSCYSPGLMIDDDIYLVKATEIPLGESYNDETSYANFKTRKEGSALTSSLFSDDPLCSTYNLATQRDLWFFGMGLGNPYYNSCQWGIPYFSPYKYGYLNPFYLYDPFGSPYGFYATAYSPWYFTGIYALPNEYNGVPQHSSQENFSNFHSGPRSVFGGFGDPNRVSGSSIKSFQYEPSLSKKNSQLDHSRIENGDIIGQHVHYSSFRNSPGSTPGASMNLRPVENRGILRPSANSNPSMQTTNEPLRSGNAVFHNNHPVRHLIDQENNRIDQYNRGSGRAGQKPIQTPVRRP